mmetsp:Transcript_31871/g.49823  ORF Transcript_31871/g.49823 Transcript_31871/m.49823 type:complete len:255 (+) Transcript_31871:75-839(+)
MLLMETQVEVPMRKAEGLGVEGLDVEALGADGIEGLGAEGLGAEELETPKSKSRRRPVALTPGLYKPLVDASAVPFVPQSPLVQGLDLSGAQGPSGLSTPSSFQGPEDAPTPRAGQDPKAWKFCRTFSSSAPSLDVNDDLPPRNQTVSYYFRYKNSHKSSFNKVTGVLENGEVLHGNKRYGNLKEFVDDVKHMPATSSITPHRVIENLTEEAGAFQSGGIEPPTPSASRPVSFCVSDLSDSHTTSLQEMLNPGK